LRKKRYPGKWSTSVASHVLAEETYETTAVNCLKSVGIKAPLIFLGTFHIEDDVENEMVAFFLCESNDEITLDLNEAVDGKFFSIEDAKQLDATPHLKKAIELISSYP